MSARVPKQVCLFFISFALETEGVPNQLLQRRAPTTTEHQSLGPRVRAPAPHAVEGRVVEEIFLRARNFLPGALHSLT